MASKTTMCPSDEGVASDAATVYAEPFANSLDRRRWQPANRMRLSPGLRRCASNGHALRAMVALFALVLVFVAPARAQSSTDPHCSMAPDDMLASLDGTWTLKQGAGMASGVAPTGMPGMPVGGITIPLPPHPPQRFTLHFDPAAGHATLSGEGQSMAMLSATPAELGAVSRYLSSADIDKLIAKGGGCAWNALPIMVGSNIYALETPATPGGKGRFSYMGLSGLKITVCVLPDGTRREATDRDLGVDQGCRQEAKPAVRHGDMKMSLIMKFQGPNRGSGVLMFEGQQDQSRFTAIAPITMSR